MTDPFRPFGAARAFPRERLARAGVDAGQLDTVAGQYNDLSADERREFTAWVDSRGDDAIRARFGQRITRDQLDEQYTVDELRDQLRNRGLPTGGRKPDLVDRLYEALTGDAPEQPAGDPVEATAAEGGSPVTPPADEPGTEPPADAVDGAPDEQGDTTA